MVPEGDAIEALKPIKQILTPELIGGWDQFAARLRSMNPGCSERGLELLNPVEFAEEYAAGSGTDPGGQPGRP
jgi:hypothetical protein